MAIEQRDSYRFVHYRVRHSGPSSGGSCACPPLVTIPLLAAVLALLFWSEHSVATATADYSFARHALAHGGSTEHGFPVHVSGTAVFTDANASEEERVALVDCLKPAGPPSALEAGLPLACARTVQQRQWKETTRRRTASACSGNDMAGTTCVDRVEDEIEYKRVWADAPIDSSRFANRDYVNDMQWPFRSTTATRKTAVVEDIHVPAALLAAAVEALPHPGWIEDGERRSAYRLLPSGSPLSVLAWRTAEDTLAPWTLPRGTQLFMAREGIRSREAMLGELASSSRASAWVARVLLTLAAGGVLSCLLDASLDLAAMGLTRAFAASASALALAALAAAIAWIPVDATTGGGLAAAAMVPIAALVRQTRAAGAPAHAKAA